MSSLEVDSVKIQKKPKVSPEANKNFVCGGCNRGYKSYPALYLHVKRKHNGVIPPNTKTIKASRPNLHISVQPGRPNKPSRDIDELDDSEVLVEVAQNDLMSFLGEKIMVTSSFGPKVSMESVVAKIRELNKANKDKWFHDIINEVEVLFNEYKEKDMKLKNIDFEEDLKTIDSENGLKVMTWFVLWLGKIYVKAEFLGDLCVVFAKIWKVLDETQLSVLDLDNKLVWKKVMKECEVVMDDLPHFQSNPDYLFDFIQKTCQLIGKTFEIRK